MSTAVSLAAAQRARINIEGIAETLKAQDRALTELTASPILTLEQLQRIQRIVKDVGERIAILRRTGLATGRNGQVLDRLSGAQRTLLDRVERADTRLEYLAQSLRSQAMNFLFLEASSVPLAGTALKRMRDDLWENEKEIVCLFQIIPSLSRGETLERILAEMRKLRECLKQQAAQVKVCLDEIAGVSCFSVEGRPDLQLSLALHSLIGEFVGPHYRSINTTCRDDTRIRSPSLRPERNLFEQAVLEWNLDEGRCIRAYIDLDIEETDLMNHFLSIATGGTSAIISASPEQWKEAVYQSIAARMIGKFHAATRRLDFTHFGDEERLDAIAQAKTDYWDAMIRGSEDHDTLEAAEAAQSLIMNAVWVLRGLTTPQGIRTNELLFETTIGAFDRVVHAACYRLFKNNLMLLGSQKEREAIAAFVRSLEVQAREEKGLTPHALKKAYRELKANALGAAKLLCYAVGNGLNQDPVTGEKCILAIEGDAELVHIFEIAQQISYFDNGRPLA